MGTFVSAPVPAAVETSLEKLLAWRLDLAHVDPSRAHLVSGGSERYKAGTPVLFRAVSGHRDTGLTTCPGAVLYARLPALAAEAQKIGLPKLYEPKVTGGLGGSVRFQARVSSALPWKVVVMDALGRRAGVGRGLGPTVDWTWNAATSSAGHPLADRSRRRYLGLGNARRRPGGRRRALSRSQSSRADPATISPNGDGVSDTSTITYATNATATVSIYAPRLDRVQRGAWCTANVAWRGGAAHHRLRRLRRSPAARYTIVITAIGPRRRLRRSAA